MIDITDPIDRLIAIKSDEELMLLRSCAVMQDAVFDKVVNTIKPGMRDVDVTAMAYAEGWVLGSSQGIYLGGSAPMGKPSYLVGRHFQDRILQEGDNLSFLVEVNGPGGYFTEVGRTIVLGKASQELLDNFAAAKEAQDYSASLLKPGVSCRDVARRTMISCSDAVCRRNCGSTATARATTWWSGRWFAPTSRWRSRPACASRSIRTTNCRTCS